MIVMTPLAVASEVSKIAVGKKTSSAMMTGFSEIFFVPSYVMADNFGG